MLAPASTSLVARVCLAWWVVCPGSPMPSEESHALNATANRDGDRAFQGRVRHPSGEQRNRPSLPRVGVGTELAAEPPQGLALPGADEIVDVTGDLDGVVEFADLGHVHPHPGPAQVLANTIEAQLDDLPNPSPAAHLDRPDVRQAAVVRIPPCLLYTSDAADEEDSVDLGGRR